MGIPLRVLLIEASADDAALLLQRLERGGYQPTHTRITTAEALAIALDGPTWDIIFSDFALPHFSGLDALLILKDRAIDTPVIFVSGTMGEDLGAEAMQAGASDFVLKGQWSRLLPAVRRELRAAELRRSHRQAQTTLQQMAFFDGLTGLPNRNQLYDRLLQAVRADRRDGKPLALLLVDLDRFRDINDTLGHHQGDLLLRQVGERLKLALRETDFIARLGGDEFAVLLPLARVEHATLVAGKIIQTLERPSLIGGLPLAVEPSIGIALFPEHATSADTLLQRADVAMYRAKQDGSGFVIYHAAIDEHNPQRLALMGELREAIDHNQLALHYQPKIGLNTGRVVGAEALLRWNHPTRGFVPPGQFIGPAERTGLIRPLTLWVLDTALRQCAEWRRAGIALPVSVNLSARNLHDAELPARLMELLQAHGADPSWIELELTESTLMADPARALDTLTRLHALGLRFAIDDFGTGYSSLGYLRQLPVSAIKIDKSFVLGMETRKDDSVIVLSTIELAHHLGLDVIAEGVETRSAWDRLFAMDCDTAQGFYMSRALPAAEFVRWLAAAEVKLALGTP